MVHAVLPSALPKLAGLAEVPPFTLQALPEGAAPQTLATPAPPHVCGELQLPQLSVPPQPFEIDPQFLPCAAQVVGTIHDAMRTNVLTGEQGLLLLANMSAAVANRPGASDLNQPIHAEIQAMRAASSMIGNYRLTGATLYVTLEPCDMCVGAMFHARIARTVYGAKDPKKQVLKSQVAIEGGVLARECGEILSAFFAAKR